LAITELDLYVVNLKICKFRSKVLACKYMSKYTTADQAQYKVHSRSQRRYMRWIERNIQSKSQPKALMAVESLVKIMRVQLTSVEMGTEANQRESSVDSSVLTVSTEENQQENSVESSVLTVSEALSLRFPTVMDC